MTKLKEDHLFDADRRIPLIHDVRAAEIASPATMQLYVAGRLSLLSKNNVARPRLDWSRA